MKIWYICKKYLSFKKLRLSLYCILSISCKIASILSPYITGTFIDGLIAANDISFVYKYCGILIILSLSTLIFQYTLNLLYVKLQMSLGVQFNLDVISHMQRLPFSKLSGRNLTQLNQQINQDTNALIIFCLQILNPFLPNLLTLAVISVICVKINSTVSLLSLVYCVLYIVAYRITKRNKYKISYALHESQNKFFATLFEQLEYIGFIRAHGIEDFFKERTILPYHDFSSNVIRDQKYSFLLSGIDTVLSLFLQITLFVVGAIQIFNRAFSVGSFVAFSSYFSIIISLIRYYYNFGSTYQEAMVSYHRINSLLQLHEEPEGTYFPERITNIHIKNLSFAFDKEQIFNICDEQFLVDHITGIAGANGSGKSTLVKLLLGFFEESISSGSILLGNVPIQDINKKYLRKKLVSLVEQDPILFRGTALDNILLDVENNKDINSRINYLAKLFSVEHIIKSDVMSETLSGGESQKIAIIRGLIKDSQILILDEPTSALDITSKNNLIEYLQKIKRGKIVIVISHDADLLGTCDQVISL